MRPININNKSSALSYPYEWSFHMLQDAALLHVDTMLENIIKDKILYRANAFDISYLNGAMAYINLPDSGVFEKHYIKMHLEKFFEHFLFPLLINSDLALDFQVFWRGSGNGIQKELMFALFSHNKLKSNYLRDLYQRIEIITTIRLLKDFYLELKSNIDLLDYNVPDSQRHWIEYDDINTYSNSAQDEKAKLIDHYVSLLDMSKVIDIGCNTGIYSQIIAPKVDAVFSVDIVPSCIDKIYTTSTKSHPNIVPVVANFSLPPFQNNWPLSHYCQAPLNTRQNFDGFIALAVMHHLTILNRVGVQELCCFVKSIAPKGIIEWVSPDEEMVKGGLESILKETKKVASYNWISFEREISKYFRIDEIITLHNGSRKLCILDFKK